LNYVKKWDKAYGGGILDINNKEKSKDSELSAYVRIRDGDCRLLKVLTKNEYAEWQSNNNGLGKILDAAHVFGKGSYPWMRYDEKNVITLNRYSHNCLDAGLSPINGKTIAKEQQETWWQRIVGDDWDHLKQWSQNRTEAYKALKLG
jgi:hypothetical protein